MEDPAQSECLPFALFSFFYIVKVSDVTNRLELRCSAVQAPRPHGMLECGLWGMSALLFLSSFSSSYSSLFLFSSSSFFSSSSSLPLFSSLLLPSSLPPPLLLPLHPPPASLPPILPPPVLCLFVSVGDESALA